MPTELYFYNQSTALFAEAYQITGTTELTLSVDRKTLTFDLNKVDRRFLKLSLYTTNLLKEEAQSFLGFSDAMIKDVAGNLVTAIPSPSYKPVTTFLKDGNPPVVTYIDMNMNFTERFGQLTFGFDDVVDRPSFQSNFLTVRHAPGNNDTFREHTFDANCVSDSLDGYEIICNMSIPDTDEIKRKWGVATSLTDTYFSWTDDLIGAETLLAVVPRGTATALPVRNYTVDGISPHLDAFDVNLTSETVTFFFSETIHIETFAQNQVTLQGLANATGSSAQYTFGTTFAPEWFDMSLNATFFTLKIDTLTLNAIKQNMALASTPTQTWLSFLAAAIEDQSGNQIVPISIEDAQNVQTFTNDHTRPTLVSFSLDMDEVNRAYLSLTFDETVKLDTFIVTDVSIQSPADAVVSGKIHTLTAGDVTSTNDTTIITTHLTVFDTDQIKLIYGLARDVSTTWLSLESTTVSDMNIYDAGYSVVANVNRVNPVVAVAKTAAMQVNASAYTPDMTPPELVAFKLILLDSVRTLTLVFNEAVESSTLRFNNITLFERFETTSYTFTGGTDITVNNFTITFRLTDHDLFSLKAESDLARNPGQTFTVL
jgi:hypothetical protein